MSIEIALVISIISVSFGVYAGVTNMKRNKSSDDKSEATKMTTIIVKLENIIAGISEIKAEINDVKTEIREVRERTIKVEESARQAHKRLDAVEKIINVRKGELQ